jgi:hypothetical protein
VVSARSSARIARLTAAAIEGVTSGLGPAPDPMAQSSARSRCATSPKPGSATSTRRKS